MVSKLSYCQSLFKGFSVEPEIFAGGAILSFWDKKARRETNGLFWLRGLDLN
jgi:hypothetical protein